MKYRVAIPPRVENALRHLHPAMKGKIKDALRMIEHDPSAGRPLRGKLAGLMSFRATHYRIIYRVARESRRIEAVDIGPKKSIYGKGFGFDLG